MAKNRTKSVVKESGLTGHRQLSLPEVLVSTQGTLLEMCAQTGLEVLRKLLEDDCTELCGEKRKWREDREAYRHGRCEGQVVLGGRKVAMERPRVRSVEGKELGLPAWKWATDQDPLDRQVMARLVAGVTTRAYAGTLEEVPEGKESLGVSHSSVSRRFIVLSERRMREFFSRTLEGIDFVVLMLDGIEFGDHTLVVALGIDRQGKKHVLGVVEGSSESSAVGEALIQNLIDRGLPVDRARLFVIDGGKGLRKAIRTKFGSWALIQRCQVHKMRNVLEHLPDGKQAWVRAAIRQAWTCGSAVKARRKLLDLATRLEEEHPGAAASIREGLDETLTILELGISGWLFSSLRSTNPIENLQSTLRRVTRNVKRWRGGKMALRWSVTGLLEAEKKFRAIKGHRDLPILIAALEAKISNSSVNPKNEVA